MFIDDERLVIEIVRILGSGNLREFIEIDDHKDESKSNRIFYEYKFLKETSSNAVISQGKISIRATCAYQILIELENYRFQGKAKSSKDIIAERVN